MRGLNLLVIVLLASVFSLYSALADDSSTIITDLSTNASPFTVLFATNISEIDSIEWDFNADGTVDSTTAEVSYTYEKVGSYLVTAVVTKKDGSVQNLNKTVTVLAPLSVSLTASPLTGTVPLSVQFIAASTGDHPVFQWDFNADGIVDSALQNPLFIFENAGTYNVTVHVTDAQGSRGTQTTTISGTTFDSGLEVSSYFPDSVTKGENQITFNVINNGKSTVRDLSGKIVGKGIQHLSSTVIPLLKPGDQDSLTIKAMLLDVGNLSAVLKLLDKSLPLNLVVAGQVTYNREELQQAYVQLKEQLQQQESIYDEKKAEEYLVNEISDAIKSVQKQLQETQEFLLTNKLGEAKVQLDLAASAIDDITQDLERSKKQKQSPLIWLKENAVAITAIVAASGTISGLLIKVKNKASQLGENVKLKMGPSTRRKDEDLPEIKPGPTKDSAVAPSAETEKKV